MQQVGPNNIQERVQLANYDVEVDPSNIEQQIPGIYFNFFISICFTLKKLGYFLRTKFSELKSHCILFFDTFILISRL